MHTKDILAQELRSAGLEEMAKKAETGYYHDYLSNLDFPEMQLAADLQSVGTPEANNLLSRHLNGEFDASQEEGDEWIRSEEGQRAFDSLPEPLKMILGAGEKKLN